MVSTGKIVMYRTAIIFTIKPQSSIISNDVVCRNQAREQVTFNVSLTSLNNPQRPCFGIL